MKKLIYLAIPYTWNPEKSFTIANVVSADLIERGYAVFSPISHGHVIEPHFSPGLELNNDFWMEQCLPILSKCEELIIVLIDPLKGKYLVDSSIGCREEIMKALEQNLKIFYYQFWDKQIIIQ